MILSIASFMKCKEHDEVWNALEARDETGVTTWFTNPANAGLIARLAIDNPDW